jgi:hypothetical protein
MSELKDRVFTMRISKTEEDYIKAAMDKMQDVRALGSRPVTKTELITILLALGMKEFDKQYGNPLESLRKKQSKK